MKKSELKELIKECLLEESQNLEEVKIPTKALKLQDKIEKLGAQLEDAIEQLEYEVADMLNARDLKLLQKAPQLVHDAVYNATSF